jgi:hypothetical protein
MSNEEQSLPLFPLISPIKWPPRSMFSGISTHFVAKPISSSISLYSIPVLRTPSGLLGTTIDVYRFFQKPDRRSMISSTCLRICFSVLLSFWPCAIKKEKIKTRKRKPERMEFERVL